MDGIIQMLPAPLRRFSTYIDFVGQAKAERIFQVVIVIASVIGFIVGYLLQQLWLTFAILGGGFVVANLIILPCWPYFRRDPIHWQPNPAEEKKATAPAPSKKEGKKHK
jgi:signal peptidase complex subunit 1|uniref:Signal peptidase complex subunit 1 n=1 Tax=Panagrolaimus sp. PS1159 TaxID=55785 RepID=A0AC35G5K0_9BILA